MGKDDVLLARWRELHRRAAEAYDDASGSVIDVSAASPAGDWTAAEVMAHVRDGHTEDEAGTVGHVVQLQMLTIDLAVDSWDLARSQGGQPLLDDALCVALHEAFAAYTDLTAQEGAFAPPVPVRVDAGGVEALVALCGRDSSWETTPAQSR